MFKLYIALWLGGITAGGQSPAFGRQAAPPMQPSSRPADSGATTQPGAQIEKWYEQLAAPEAEVRDRARIELMSLDRRDLETLRRIVKADLPPSAAQASALRDIVTQVYLAGEDYESLPTGFLGVKLAIDRPVVLKHDQGADPDAPTPISGVPVDEAMAGFCAYGLLQPGDLIYQVDAMNRTLTPTAMELIQVISGTPPGHVITLHLLRQGQLMRVSLRLSARPRDAVDGAAGLQFFNERARLAEQYWASHFAALVDRGMG